MTVFDFSIFASLLTVSIALQAGRKGDFSEVHSRMKLALAKNMIGFFQT